jgi:hypothetical protein
MKYHLTKCHRRRKRNNVGNSNENIEEIIMKRKSSKIIENNQWKKIGNIEIIININGINEIMKYQNNEK